MPRLKEGCSREIKGGFAWCPVHAHYILKCLAGPYPNAPEDND